MRASRTSGKRGHATTAAAPHNPFLSLLALPPVLRAMSTPAGMQGHPPSPLVVPKNIASLLRQTMEPVDRPGISSVDPGLPQADFEVFSPTLPL